MANKPMKISETDFSSQVEDLLKLFGWRCYHTWTSIHSPRGMPDLILAKTLDDNVTVLVAAELKNEKGKLSLPQAEWLEILSKVNGIFAFVWKPSDFDLILSLLQSEGLPDIIKVWKKFAPSAKEHFELSLVMQKKG